MCLGAAWWCGSAGRVTEDVNLRQGNLLEITIWCAKQRFSCAFSEGIQTRVSILPRVRPQFYVTVEVRRLLDQLFLNGEFIAL